LALVVIIGVVIFLVIKLPKEKDPVVIYIEPNNEQVINTDEQANTPQDEQDFSKEQIVKIYPHSALCGGLYDSSRTSGFVDMKWNQDLTNCLDAIKQQDDKKVEIDANNIVIIESGEAWYRNVLRIEFNLTQEQVKNPIRLRLKMLCKNGVGVSTLTRFNEWKHYDYSTEISGSFQPIHEPPYCGSRTFDEFFWDIPIPNDRVLVDGKLGLLFEPALGNAHVFFDEIYLEVIETIK
jgi:hypothetical protein